MDREPSTRPGKKIIASFLLLLYAALYVVSGLDHRFSWSHIPVPVVLVGDLYHRRYGMWLLNHAEDVLHAPAYAPASH